MRYVTAPDVKVTLGTTTYTNTRTLNIRVIRVENGFDTATIDLAELSGDLYSGVVDAGTAVQLDVKDRSESSYPANPLFKGVVRFPVLPTGDRETVLLKCDGAGYGFGDTVCGQEYGLLSRYGTSVDTISEILTDASYGIITKWVNKVMESATASGFSYTTSIDANLTNVINYIAFPYKPCLNAINDLCDLLTAIRVEAAATGPHWIVTTDDVFRMKRLGSDDANWHKYYNAATADAESALYQGRDFTAYQFEPMGPEANYIIYYGTWRRPSNGDAWTENNAAAWTTSECTLANDSDAADVRVNSYSLLMTSTSAVNPWAIYYPTGAAGWQYDFTSFREYNVPALKFWAKRSNALATAAVYLSDVDGNYFSYVLWHNVTGGPMASGGKWYHFALPIGEYYRDTTSSELWSDAGGGTWDDIDRVYFLGNAANGETFHLDGLHFGDAAVCRVAYNSTRIAADKLKTLTITDDVGKDDTLTSGTPGTTDTGLMARMAYAELLRRQDTDLVGWVTTKLIKDVLPGQLFNVYARPAGATYRINGTEMRVPKLYQDITAAGATSTLFLTDDVTNSRPRPRYEDWNRVIQHAASPAFQDRQSSSIKAGSIDIRVPRYEEDYG